MLKVYFSAFLLLFSVDAFSKPPVDLVYADLKFAIPGGVTVVGDAGDRQNILIFRYGDEPGKDFLAFSNMTSDATIDYGCPVNIFFKEVFFGDAKPECNQGNVRLMQEVFVEERDIETWPSNDYEIVFSGSSGKSYVFIIGNDGKLVKIDSDFLDNASFKKVIGNL